MEQREYLNHCPPDAQAACVGNKVLSRNANGTIAMTSQPSNESELQLYRVLQRANLLSYYDTFIGQGGDDVQQLCEAGEEEFLEIMALVGMASKPLHVRRLQKALQEWVSNPAMFQTPLVPSIGVHGMPPLPRPMNLSQHGPPPAPPNLGLAPPQSQGTPPSCAPGPPPGPSLCSGVGGSGGGGGGGGLGQQCGSTTPGPSSAPMSMMSITPIPPPSSRPSPPMQMVSNNHPPSPSFTTKESIPSPSSQITPQPASLSQCSDPGMGDYGQPGSPLQLTPVLVESQIQRLSEAAELLVKTLPPFEPKPQNTKKKICKELEYVMNMAEDDPRRMEEIRKYAAIYGRFDCKRKPEKPLTLHEVSVNEAAAQICRHIPALLTRRDELFPLARQVVRDSGYQYSKGHSNWGDSCRPHGYGCRQYNNGEDSGGKRPRMDQGSPDGSGSGRLTGIKRQERLESISEELKQVGLQQDEARMRLSQQRDTQDFGVLQQLQQQLEHLNGQQVQLMAEQSELMKRPGRPRHDPEYGQNSDTQQPWPGYGLQARLSPRSYYGKGNGRISSCSDPDRPDSDDTDSQYSFSNASSPSQDIHDSSSQDYCSNQSAGDLRGVPVADMLALKHKKANAQLTKQMMQETLMDEGLRVVKELSNQIKEEADGLVLTGLSSLHHHHHHHPHQSHPTHPHSHTHQHHYPQHHPAHHHDQQQMRGRPASFPGHHVSGNNGSGSSSATPPAGGHCGPMASHQNGQSDGGASASGGNGGGGGSSSDVEKAAANTINALLSLSQTAGASGPSSGSSRVSSTNNPNASHSHSPHTHSHHSHSQSQSHNPHNVNNPVPGATVKQEMSSPMGLKSD